MIINYSTKGLLRMITYIYYPGTNCHLHPHWQVNVLLSHFALRLAFRRAWC